MRNTLESKKDMVVANKKQNKTNNSIIRKDATCLEGYGQGGGEENNKREGRLTYLG